MPLFTDLNKMLQSDEPKLFILHKHMQHFLRKLLGRFVKAEVLATSSVRSVNIDDATVLLSLDKVMIGFSTRSIINSNDLHHEKDKVARNCSFHDKYAISRLPLHDPVVLLGFVEGGCSACANCSAHAQIAGRCGLNR